MSRFTSNLVVVFAVALFAIASPANSVRFTSQQQVRVQTNEGWLQFLVWNFGLQFGFATNVQDGTSNTFLLEEVEIGADNFVGVFPYDYNAAAYTDALYYLNIGQ